MVEVVVVIVVAMAVEAEKESDAITDSLGFGNSVEGEILHRRRDRACRSDTSHCLMPLCHISLSHVTHLTVSCDTSHCLM